MPMTLRDARRMVAKSRRRVWRLCRGQEGPQGLLHWHARHRGLAPDTSAHLLILMLSARRNHRAADRLLREYEDRRARLTTLEWGRHRAQVEAAIERMIERGTSDAEG